MEILALLGEAGVGVIPYPILTEDQRKREGEKTGKPEQTRIIYHWVEISSKTR